MATIKLTEGFSLIPEGTHIFKITNVDYKEAYGKLEITLKTAEGQSHIERFSLIKENGAANDGAYKAFSFFAKTALNNFSVSEIEPSQLVGRYLKCEVKHDTVPSKKDPNKNTTFIRLGDKSPADGFVGEAPAAASTGFDLNSLLG
jgi:hypothetical protein